MARPTVLRMTVASCRSERSILISSIGRWCRPRTDDQPVPKSSIDSPTPSAAQRVEDLGGAIGVGHDRALGELELERRRRDAVRAQAARDVVGQAAVEQAARGDVHRDAQVQAAVAPLADLGERLVEDVHRQRVHEAGVLGVPDEARRQHEPALGMAPAHERLDALDLAGARWTLGW